jgi:hypothetical protein
MPKSRRATLEKKLDDLWRRVGKESARCEVCETLPSDEQFHYSKLDPHHIVGRSNRLLRWDLRNRIFLCPSHHTLGKLNAQNNQGGWFWSKFTEKEDWLGKYRPEDKKYLEKMMTIPFKQWTIEQLEEKVKELENYEVNDEYRDSIVRLSRSI